MSVSREVTRLFRWNEQLEEGVFTGNRVHAVRRGRLAFLYAPY